MSFSILPTKAQSILDEVNADAANAEKSLRKRGRSASQNNVKGTGKKVKPGKSTPVASTDIVIAAVLAQHDTNAVAPAQPSAATAFTSSSGRTVRHTKSASVDVSPVGKPFTGRIRSHTTTSAPGKVGSFFSIRRKPLSAEDARYAATYAQIPEAVEPTATAQAPAAAPVAKHASPTVAMATDAAPEATTLAAVELAPAPVSTTVTPRAPTVAVAVSEPSTSPLPSTWMAPTTAAQLRQNGMSLVPLPQYGTFANTPAPPCAAPVELFELRHPRPVPAPANAFDALMRAKEEAHAAKTHGNKTLKTTDARKSKSKTSFLPFSFKSKTVRA